MSKLIGIQKVEYDRKSDGKHIVGYRLMISCSYPGGVGQMIYNSNGKLPYFTEAQMAEWGISEKDIGKDVIPVESGFPSSCVYVRVVEK